MAYTLFIGVAITARSTPVSRAETDSKHACPCMVWYLGLTGSTVPENPPSTRFLISALPSDKLSLSYKDDQVTPMIELACKRNQLIEHDPASPP
jgi:hypothetical protein